MSFGALVKDCMDWRGILGFIILWQIFSEWKIIDDNTFISWVEIGCAIIFQRPISKSLVIGCCIITIGSIWRAVWYDRANISNAAYNHRYNAASYIPNCAKLIKMPLMTTVSWTWQHARHCMHLGKNRLSAPQEGNIKWMTDYRRKSFHLLSGDWLYYHLSKMQTREPIFLLSWYFVEFYCFRFMKIDSCQPSIFQWAHAFMLLTFVFWLFFLLAIWISFTWKLKRWFCCNFTSVVKK